MRVVCEVDLVKFKFWGGAKSTANLLTSAEIKNIEIYLEELGELELLTEYEVNDFFWFETDWIAKFLGFEDFEELYRERTR